MKLEEIGQYVQRPIRGDGTVEIVDVKSLDDAGPQHLSFVASNKYLQSARKSGAGALILPENAPDWGVPAILSDNPYLTLAKIKPLFYQPPLPEGACVHPSAVISEDVVMGQDCWIGPHVVLDSGVRLGNGVRILANCTVYPGVSIGDETTIHANCVIREYCVVGSRVLIQNGVVIGSDGFGFARDERGAYHKILQTGRVVIGDDVEIQANTCVDRGALGDTIIESGVKLDNLIQIAHGCKIGKNTVMAAQSGLAGSVQVGSRVVIAGQAGFSDHICVGDGAVITAKCGVMNDVPAGVVWAGAPGYEAREWRRMSVAMTKLPELLDKMKALEKQLKELSPHA